MDFSRTIQMAGDEDIVLSNGSNTVMVVPGRDILFLRRMQHRQFSRLLRRDFG